MSEAIIVAIITGGLSLIGAIVSNNRTAQSMDAKLDKQQAVTETKLEELTREVRTHNNFAQRDRDVLMDSGQGTRCPPRWHRMQDSNLRQPVLETGAPPNRHMRLKNFVQFS